MKKQKRQYRQSGPNGKRCMRRPSTNFIVHQKGEDVEESETDLYSLQKTFIKCAFVCGNAFCVCIRFFGYFFFCFSFFIIGLPIARIHVFIQHTRELK